MDPNRRIGRGKPVRSWRRNQQAITPERRTMIATMMFAAPLAGILAAIAGLYADSGLLGILVATLSFVLLSVVMAPPPGGAAG